MEGRGGGEERHSLWKAKRRGGREGNEGKGGGGGGVEKCRGEERYQELSRSAGER